MKTDKTADKTKEQASTMLGSQRTPPKTYHHWWFIGIFASMLIIAGAVYLVASSRGEVLFPRGPNDSVDATIENFYQLSQESRIAMIDDLEAALDESGRTDRDLYAKLINAYVNSGDYGTALTLFEELELITPSEEKDFAFYANGTRWAVGADDSPKAKTYFDLAMSKSSENTSDAFQTDVTMFRLEMEGLISE